MVESFDPSSELPLVSPLITQPVIETCIRIPSWWWYERGFNRAVARNAFTEFLPAAITERRSKGGLDSFIAELFQHHRASIAASLLDGVLVERGLLNRAAVAAALSEQGPVQSIDFMRIMRLVDVEVWGEVLLTLGPQCFPPLVLIALCRIRILAAIEPEVEPVQISIV